jgi:hypothetical protein
MKTATLHVPQKQGPYGNRPFSGMLQHTIKKVYKKALYNYWDLPSRIAG